MQKVQTAYYVFLLIVADLLVPLTIMSVAYGLIARTLWKGFKSMQVVGKLDRKWHHFHHYRFLPLEGALVRWGVSLRTSYDLRFP